MLTNGTGSADHTNHPLAPYHNKTSSSRRISANHSQTSVDINGDMSGSSATRDLLSPYRTSTGDPPYYHDDQLSNADSGIRSGSYYEKVSMADSAIVGASDYEDRESSPESGIRPAPLQSERVKNSHKSSVSLHHPMVMSQSSSSLQRVHNSISPSAIHMATLSQANNSPHRHRLSVPSYLSSCPHQSSAWETPHSSTVIVVTHTGNEIDSHSAKSVRTSTSQCHHLTPESSVQIVSAQPAISDTNEDANNASSDDSNDDDESDSDAPRCVDIAWPKSWKRRIIYPFLFPLIIVLYFTLPDVNKPVSSEWFDRYALICNLL